MQAVSGPSRSDGEQDGDHERTGDHEEHGCERNVHARHGIEVSREDDPDPSAGDGTEGKADRERDDGKRDGLPRDRGRDLPAGEAE